LVLEPASTSANEINEEWLNALGHALAIFIEGNSSGRTKSRADLETSKPETLTSRQLQVLQGMAEGLIYAQIASNLHVSESLVKQEASKIFKFLGVSGRSEALTAGKKLLEAMPLTPIDAPMAKVFRDK
jgi:DNA-binding NarL/FixJ family response regulator